jgi:hypothetical protein
MKRNAIILLATLCTALLLSILTMLSPSPANKDDRFSAERAFKHLEVIAQKQHSVFDRDEIAKVRSYLEQALDAFENVKWNRVNHKQFQAINNKRQVI